MERDSILKNTGPDLDKIPRTQKTFAPRHRHLILGYPPFLKRLIDLTDPGELGICDHRMDPLVGEGMTEGLRDYLLRRLDRVYCDYGATDLEIAIADEPTVCDAICRLARDNPAVRQALFGDDFRLPMLFQYDPLTHHIEVNAEDELQVTITRDDDLSPRICCSVHDQGGVCRYDAMAAKLSGYGLDLALSEQAGGTRLSLPFVWVYDRPDCTVGVTGANIYLEDIELR